MKRWMFEVLYLFGFNGNGILIKSLPRMFVVVTKLNVCNVTVYNVWRARMWTVNTSMFIIYVYAFGRGTRYTKARSRPVGPRGVTDDDCRPAPVRRHTFASGYRRQRRATRITAECYSREVFDRLSRTRKTNTQDAFKRNVTITGGAAAGEICFFLF